ncbi:NAD(P)-binding protein [Clavulina sp. PMI_390]|nr:NAD(P)-binding protein [Clavulina sp. PMI_390]
MESHRTPDLKPLTPVLSRTQSNSELVKGKDFPYSRPSTPLLHHTPQLGFIGLGTMGYYMARNLANSSDHPLMVYNRSTSKAEKMAKDMPNKVLVAHSIAELVEKCDVVFSSLANDDVVKAIYAEIVKNLEAFPPLRTKIFVEASTNYPTTTGELDEMISKASPMAHFVACPVFGAPAAADKRQLLIVLAGELKIKKEVAYLVVPALGSRIVDMGGNVEKAAKLKIIGNSMILGQIELLAEAMTLADKSEVGAANLYDVIKGKYLAARITTLIDFCSYQMERQPSCPLLRRFFSSQPFLGYGAKILNDQFDGSTGFALEGGLKDASYARKLAIASNSPVPTVDTAHQNLIAARAMHARLAAKSAAPFEVLDWSALAAGIRVQAGLPAFDSSLHGGVRLEEDH